MSAVLEGFVDQEIHDLLTTLAFEAPVNPKRKPKAAFVFGADQSVKKLVLAPERTNDMEVLHPTVRVSTVREAKNACANRHAGWFRTKEGSARIVYGSFGDGDLQA